MADPAVYWYSNLLAEDEIERLVQNIERGGLSIEHPGLHRITALRADGSQLETARPALLGRIAGVASGQDPSDYTFQWWLSADVDVICGFESLGDGIRHKYSLDGLDLEERALVVGALWQALLPLIAKTRAFLVDFHSDARELDLESLVRSGGVLSAYSWDLAVVRQSSGGEESHVLISHIR